MEFSYIAYGCIVILIIRDIYKDVQLYRLEKQIYRQDIAKAYASIINLNSYILGILLDNKIVVPPKDFKGSKQRLIFNTLTTVAPEALKFVKEAEFDETDNIKGSDFDSDKDDV